jgi:hypothetical protein
VIHHEVEVRDPFGHRIGVQAAVLALPPADVALVHGRHRLGAGVSNRTK